VERLDLKLAAQVAVSLKIRFSPRVLNGGVTVRLRLNPASGVMPEQLRAAFEQIAALADLGNTRLVIDRQDELEGGAVFHIDSVEPCTEE